MFHLTQFILNRGYSFISVQIDGKTEADFYCSFEGLYYYAFHLAEIVWGVLWLYDLQLMTSRPGLFTGKYLMYYACVAYFSSFGFSIVLYFQNVDNFTSAANLLCSVVDDDAMGYYLMFNIPIVIYGLLFLYTFFKYEKGYLAEQAPVAVSQQDNDQEAPLAAKANDKKLSPALYHKLAMNMKIQRYYFLLYLVSIVPNFFILSDTGLEWYSLFNCLHPIVIIVILLWAISIDAQNLERKSGGPAD